MSNIYSMTRHRAIITKNSTLVYWPNYFLLNSAEWIFSLQGRFPTAQRWLRLGNLTLQMEIQAKYLAKCNTVSTLTVRTVTEPLRWTQDAKNAFCAIILPVIVKIKSHAVFAILFRKSPFFAPEKCPGPDRIPSR